jgi:hypothetical protein
MKVRMLKDWSWYREGDVADVFDPLGEDWIRAGIAEPSVAPKAERATIDHATAERAVEPRKFSKKG